MPVEITSPAHIQQVLGADLGKVTVINFWAGWVDLCEPMNASFAKIEAEFPNLQFLSVEVESQQDIAESFDVQVVPYFIVLRGHTSLIQVAAVDEDLLRKTIADNSRVSTQILLSKSDAKPAAPPTEEVLEATRSVQETTEEKCARLIKSADVMLFIKGTPAVPKCGFSRTLITAMKDLGVQYDTFDILTDDAVRAQMKVINDWPTFPQIHIRGEFVGGLDVVKEMIATGDFQAMIEDTS